jgi:serine/threonine protein kinase
VLDRSPEPVDIFGSRTSAAAFRHSLGWTLDESVAARMAGNPQFAAGVRAGDVLVGKYRIEKVLGAGGMGVVVAAHHLHLDERVAIKFLLPEALGNPEAISRFAREARAAVKIKSEHVARVSDVGTLDNGAPYMVMEYLEGDDLADWVQKQGPLAVEQATEFVLQACEAIAEAHGLGIVHRDLKPANLFCIRRSDGRLSVKVLDFGISKVTRAGASGADMGMTKTAAVFGSPLFMSPEQLQSARDVDARTDIWSVGVILFELLTGKVPFVGETFPDLCIKIATQRTPLPTKLRPEIPSGLEQVILKCLAKDRGRRFQNVAELALALAPYAPRRARASVERISGIIQSAGLSASALELPPSSGAAGESSQPATMASWENTTDQTKGRGRRLFLVALGSVLLAGVIGVAWTRTWSASTSEPLPSTLAEPASAFGPVPEVSSSRDLAPKFEAAAPSGSAAAPVDSVAVVPQRRDPRVTLRTPTLVPKRAALPPSPAPPRGAMPAATTAPPPSARPPAVVPPSELPTPRSVYDDRR